MAERVLPTMQALSEEQNASGEGGRLTEQPLEIRTVKPKSMIRESRERSGWYSSLRVWGGVWATMISHGVEISIVRGVRKMVRDPNLIVFLVIFFLYHVLCISTMRNKDRVQH